MTELSRFEQSVYDSGIRHGRSDMQALIDAKDKEISELESQVAAYHAAAARVAGDALRARQDALEEAAKECDTFVEAYSPEFFRPLPPGYVYSADETRAAGLFAHGRFKVAAAKIRALSGPEGVTDAEKNARNQGSDEN
jgi:TATA-box binding protein (TBP) (component of TFIID and TFIIIB)